MIYLLYYQARMLLSYSAATNFLKSIFAASSTYYVIIF
jgi:hypothetical protein